MKLRTGDPWMSGADYGRSLRGLSVNLLVRDIAVAIPFHHDVLGAQVIYSDPDFGVFRHGIAEWMLHADHTYLGHPLHANLANGRSRGLGTELRLHGRDPDAAEAAARRLGFTVLAPATDKPHGLREVYLIDADGYLWVPDVPLPKRPRAAALEVEAASQAVQEENR